ncbi:bactofilin family protein [Rubrivivax gelatinosus]|uniref:Cytoskeletal protein CcmA (Bactofilin family) n=1 Tax=Rubrivivax gelatinosus (strain NBRC 100245 / IL144) TaxID=983917 RepID=I0HV60_RUBGI|nr:polymer-forming cytoskeletal protein [Rubrivivax gelatinosus]MBG6078830.1 cytoskeletal protein CcmA (bactofilin family) [Rubrivivax gelatinosus]BAL96897.1 hypothetical protein RGE_35580 [Rubrivivax gelatinosus IL144]
MLFNKPKSERGDAADSETPPAAPAPGAVLPVLDDAVRRKSARPEDARPSVLGPGVLVRGYIGSPGPLHFQGDIEGTVEAPQVTLGAEGSIRGQMACDRATLDGHFDGRLQCRELNVGASARVDGQVRCDNLVLAMGALINAEVSIGPRE